MSIDKCFIFDVFQTAIVKRVSPQPKLLDPYDLIYHHLFYFCSRQSCSIFSKSNHSRGWGRLKGWRRWTGRDDRLIFSSLGPFRFGSVPNRTESIYYFYLFYHSKPNILKNNSELFLGSVWLIFLAQTKLRLALKHSIPKGASLSPQSLAPVFSSTFFP